MTVTNWWEPAATENHQNKKTLNGRQGIKNSLVCNCGHSTRQHFQTGNGDEAVCTPGRQNCKCRKVRPVLATNNLRLFMGKTEGPGAEHALGKGIVHATIKNAETCWLTQNGTYPTNITPGTPGNHGHRTCDICLTPTPHPIPTAVNTHDGTIANENTGLDKLVCANCYIEWSKETN